MIFYFNLEVHVYYNSFSKLNKKLSIKIWYLFYKMLIY